MILSPFLILIVCSTVDIGEGFILQLNHFNFTQKLL